MTRDENGEEVTRDSCLSEGVAEVYRYRIRKKWLNEERVRR